MQTDTLVLFIWSSFLVTIAPGPDLLMVIQLAVQQGWKVAFRLALGLCSGLVLHTLLVAWGMGSLLDIYPQLFWGIKIFGVGYFLYLAWLTWKTRKQTEQSKQKTGGWITGFVMNISNPKVFLFFLGFLPQFLFHPSWPTTFQLSVLGMLFLGQALLVFTTVIAISVTIRPTKWVFLSHPYAQMGIWLFFASWIAVA
ncbi:MAG: LysE family translocator [Flavobacteriaceae bacterium]